jgi:2-octaprenyl-6-methoxyphenol hydroxylase
MKADTEALIVGGGLIGPATALALAKGGVRSILIDAAPAEARKDPEFDGRAYAVSLASLRFWKALGVWPRVAAHAQIINDIIVSDGRPGEGASPWFLHFDHRELDGGVYGYMLEDRYLRNALLDMTDAEPLVETRTARVARTEVEGGLARAHLEGGETLTARVLIGCDGRASRVGADAGIRRTGWDYGQTGLVCAVAHAAPHHGVAHEYFLPAGPFAILPLPGNRSSLVWTERTEEGARIHALDDAGYLAEIRTRFGDFLGEISLEGKRFAYPLKLSLSNHYAAPRVALVGDAAHAVHPIAGQGLNLGVRDVAALAEVLVEARRRGEDIGALDVLQRYEAWRRFDSTALALAMDALNRLFSNDSPALRIARDAGLAMVSATGPARRFFMQSATGVKEGNPRLLEGREL